MSVVSNDRSTFVITEENVSVPESLELDRMLIFSLLSLLLLLLTSASADPSARLGRKSLSDDDLLKALAILLAEAEGEVPRQGRNQETSGDAHCCAWAVLGWYYEAFCERDAVVLRNGFLVVGSLFLSQQ